MNNQILQEGQNTPSNEPQSESKLFGQSKTKRIRTRVKTSAQLNNEEDEVYKKVLQSRFKQQDLPAWRPVPTILSIIIVFSVFGILFIILGIVLLVYSSKIHSAELDYTDCPLDDTCTKSITLEEDIDSPVFIYYQLIGFFQNSRRYVKSKEIDQLTGDDIKAHDNCEPAETNEQMALPYGWKALDGTSDLTLSSTAVPCGLMAKTLFNDTYALTINGASVPIDETNIAFEKDKDLFDKNPNPSLQWTDMTKEHFLVWMRPAGLPNPKKLWGRINRDLKKGEVLEFTIDNRYNVTHYDGKKKIVLSNATKFGGKNKFLGISYIVVGALSIICAIMFPIGNKFMKDKEKNL